MPIPMTVHGAESLRAELAERKGEIRQSIVKDIAEARAHGDLKENAEYHAAREQQSLNEGRIQDIESKLADAQIIDVTKIPATGKVVFGATVTIADEESDDETTYQIVGEDEADLKFGKISVLSPISRALIGKDTGDVASVNSPSGVKDYEIIKVEHL
uniref:Transcription elongation factor GreA n=1 Tax=uncultured gamma proteobacterium HF0070_08D07 TaxID=710983 RepID=E0XRV0_9GAMM|nr:transcription elongation factor [uncultured gamma proteobacterium HF0070_08D07]